MKNVRAITYPRLVIAGLRGGSGKTIVSVGLVSALKERGLSVVPYKKGPDYIDAGWLSSAAGSPCYNLDPFMIGEDMILSSFVSHFNGDYALIEGNRGLFDGMDAEGSMSTAVVAKTLKSPVILVIDCTKMTRTTAAIVMGVTRFDRALNLGGVILNRIAGGRHERVIRDSINKYTGVPVLGALPKLRELALPERHMGLTPFQEHPEVEGGIEKVRDIIKQHVDLDAVLDLAKGAPPLIKAPKLPALSRGEDGGVKIGIIRDSAFQFYYPENFEELQRRGARLVEVSALKDKTLQPVDALYIGGGFPETHAIYLADNKSFRDSLKKAVRGGLPIYAECGGLMYLGRALTVEGKDYPMAGIFPLKFALHKKPQAHGYTVVKVTNKNPFFRLGTLIKGHEFHYSAATGGEGLDYCLRMKRGEGIYQGKDGVLHKNVFATYTHIHALGCPEWADGMIRAAEEYRKSL